MRSMRVHSGVAVTAAALLGAGTVATLTVAPAGPAFAAPPTVCTATGGTITTDTLIDGIRWNVHVFNSSATFTPAQNTNVQYLVVGGGGGGRDSSGRPILGAPFVAPLVARATRGGEAERPCAPALALRGIRVAAANRRHQPAPRRLVQDLPCLRGGAGRCPPVDTRCRRS